MRLALVGRFLVAVDQHHRDAGLGGDEGDARAHEAGAQHAHLGELGRLDAGRAARALVELLQRDEERADHHLRFGRLHDLGEVALLDAKRGVERHQQPLIGAFQDRGGGGIVAVGLAAQDGDCRRPQIGAGRRIDGTAGQLEALLVPGLDRLQAVPDHLLGRLDQLVGRGDLVDQAHLLGLLGRQVLARGQHLQRLLRIGQARDALGAAGAREDADLDLGQRHPDLVAVSGHAAVAGERQLERAAHAGAVDGRDPGLAGGLELAPQPAHAAGAVEQHLDRRVGVLLLFLGEEAQHLLQHGEVGAAGKRVLAGGDDGALDRLVGGNGLDDRLQLVHHLLGEDVHGAAGQSQVTSAMPSESVSTVKFL
jgi:hypothetical protein